MRARSVSVSDSARNRLLVPVLFVGSLTAVWLLRWGFAQAGGTEETRRAAGKGARAGGETAAVYINTSKGRGEAAADGEFDPRGLASVASGLVVWPAGGDRAAVSAAFAAAWQKLRPVWSGAWSEDEPVRLQARRLFEDWWRVDPKGALQYVSGPRGAFEDRGGGLLLPLLVKKDPRAAWELVGKSVDPFRLTMVRSRVLGVWAERDPDAVMAFAGGLSGPSRRAAEEAALRAWPVEKAMEWCAALPSTWWRMRMESAAVAGLLREDPARASEMLRAGTLKVESVAALFGEGRNDAAAFTRGALAAAGAEPLAFCEWAGKSGSPELARAAWTAYVETQKDLTPAAVSALAARAGADTAEALSAALAHTAPETALAWAAANKGVTAPFFSAWAEDDPAAALAAAGTLPDSGPARLAIAEKCVATDPRLAIEALLEHPDKAAAAPVLLKASRGAAYTDPALALAALDAAGEAATAVEVTVAMTLGGRVDPAGTAAALARYDLPVTDYLAVEAFARGWADRDPGAASEWVTELPAGDLRDGGAAGLTRRVGDADPVGGYLWALEIGDREIRERVLAPWRERLARDPAALESMAADTRLTPDRRSALRAAFAPAPPAAGSGAANSSPTSTP